MGRQNNTLRNDKWKNKQNQNNSKHVWNETDRCQIRKCQLDEKAIHLQLHYISIGDKIQWHRSIYTAPSQKFTTPPPQINFIKKDLTSGLYVLHFLKRQGHQGIFSLVKGTLWGNWKFLPEHFKGPKATDQGQWHNLGPVCYVFERTRAPSLAFSPW